MFYPVHITNYQTFDMTIIQSPTSTPPDDQLSSHFQVVYHCDILTAVVLVNLAHRYDSSKDLGRLCLLGQAFYVQNMSSMTELGSYIFEVSEQTF